MLLLRALTYFSTRGFDFCGGGHQGWIPLFFFFPVFRAGDITELKILQIPGPRDNKQSRDLQHNDLGTSGVGCQVGTNQNGTGKLLKKPTSSSSAPQAIPRRTELKNQEVVISPQQQQCSKSYIDRHMESLNQSKGFRRRHNSCEYVAHSAAFPSP